MEIFTVQERTKELYVERVKRSNMHVPRNQKGKKGNRFFEAIVAGNFQN